MARKLVVALVGSVFLWLTVSCSGFKGKAQEFFEKGAYEDAVFNYERAAAEDPTDTEAVLGLKKAREKLIDTKLLEIRKSRLAGNSQNSLDMLLQLVERQNKWNFYPMGAVASTQEEETREAWSYLRFSTDAAIRNGFVLQASWLLSRYKPVFQGKTQGVFLAEEKKAQRTGRQKCAELTTKISPSLAYFSLFVKKFCARFGTSLALPAPVESRRLSGLYNMLQFSMHVDGLNEQSLGVFRQSLEKALFTTPWFDPKATEPARVSIHGHFTYTHERVPETKAHQYSMQIPYTDYRRVRKDRTVPYEDSDYRCEYTARGDRHCRSVPVTRFRTESYYENEPFTAYRSELRVQTYNGWSHFQKIALALQGQCSLARHERAISVSGSDEARNFEHSFNMPDIGLRPQQPDLLDPDRWLEKQANNAAEQFKGQAIGLWDSLYCQAAKGGGLAEAGNQVHQCLRLRLANPPSYAEHWYTTHFGVSVSAADTLLGLSDL